MCLILACHVTRKCRICPPSLYGFVTTASIDLHAVDKKRLYDRLDIWVPVMYLVKGVRVLGTISAVSAELKVDNQRRNE